MHLPTFMTSIAREELLPFYFARIGGRTYHNVITRAWYAPSGLDRHIEPFRDLIGGFEELEPYNTLLPSQMRFLTSAEVKTVRRHSRERAVFGIQCLIGMGGWNSGWAKPIPAVCPDCAMEDIAPCGMPFWNRSHLMPGVSYCSRHQRPLESACHACINFSIHPRRSSWPGMHCGCGLRPIASSGLSSTKQEQEIELHRVSALLLNPSYRHDINREAVARAAAHQAEHLGLTVEGYPKPARILDFFTTHPLRPLLDRMRVCVDGIPSLKCLRGSSVYRHPLQSITFLSALHGSWSNVERWVEANCKPTRRPATEPGLTRRKRPNEMQYRANWMRKNHAKWHEIYSTKYAVLRVEHPALSHARLMQMLPSNAEKFINQSSLSEAGVSVPFVASDDVERELIDKDMSRHVLERAKRLVAEQYPHVISRPVLTRGHQFEKYLVTMKDKLPLTSAALATCVETRSACRKRLSGTPVPGRLAVRQRQRRAPSAQGSSLIQFLAVVKV